MVPSISQCVTKIPIAKLLMFGGDDISESEIEVVLGNISVTHTCEHDNIFYKDNELLKDVALWNL